MICLFGYYMPVFAMSFACRYYSFISECSTANRPIATELLKFKDSQLCFTNKHVYSPMRPLQTYHLLASLLPSASFFRGYPLGIKHRQVSQHYSHRLSVLIILQERVSFPILSSCCLLQNYQDLVFINFEKKKVESYRVCDLRIVILRRNMEKISRNQSF